MLFISREKSPSYVMVHGSTEFFPNGVLKKAIKPGILYFQPFEQPFQVFALPTKDGVARGYLESGEAAERLRKDGHTFLDDDEDDVTEFALIDFLYGLPDYGVSIIAVGGRTGEEIAPSDRFVIEQPEKSGFTHYCRLCKKNFKSLAGAEGHENTSEEHKKNLAAVTSQAWTQAHK